MTGFFTNFNREKLFCLMSALLLAACVIYCGTRYTGKREYKPPRRGVAMTAIEEGGVALSYPDTVTYWDLSYPDNPFITRLGIREHPDAELQLPRLPNWQWDMPLCVPFPEVRSLEQLLTLQDQAYSQRSALAALIVSTGDFWSQPVDFWPTDDTGQYRKVSEETPIQEQKDDILILTSTNKELHGEILEETPHTVVFKAVMGASAFTRQYWKKDVLLRPRKTLSQVYAERSQAIAAGNAQDRYNLAILCLQSRLHDEAGRELEKIIAESPDFVSAYLQLGELHLQRGETQKALQTYFSGMRATSNSEFPYRIAAQLFEFYPKELPHVTIKYLQEALRLAQENPESQASSQTAKILGLMGRVQLILGQWNEAEDSFEQVRRMSPDSYVAAGGLGLLRLHAREFTEAGDYFTEAMLYILDEEDGVLQEIDAIYSKLSGEDDSAVISTEDEIRLLKLEEMRDMLYREEAELFNGRGCAEFASGNLLGAWGDFTDGLQLDPTNHQILTNGAALCVIALEYDLALRILQVDAENNPFNRARTHLLQGIAYSRQEAYPEEVVLGAFQEAKARLSQLTAEEVREIDFFQGLYWSQRDPARAIVYFHDLLSREPTFSIAALYQHELYLKIGDADNAEKVLQKALGAAPGEHLLRLALAGFYITRPIPQFDNAVAQLQQILDQDPYHIEALNALAYCLNRMPERAKQALPTFQQVLDLDPANAYAMSGSRLIREAMTRIQVFKGFDGDNSDTLANGWNEKTERNGIQVELKDGRALIAGTVTSKQKRCFELELPLTDRQSKRLVKLECDLSILENSAGNLIVALRESARAGLGISVNEKGETKLALDRPIALPETFVGGHLTFVRDDKGDRSWSLYVDGVKMAADKNLPAIMLGEKLVLAVYLEDSQLDGKLEAALDNVVLTLLK